MYSTKAQLTSERPKKYNQDSNTADLVDQPKIKVPAGYNVEYVVTSEMEIDQ